MLENLNTEDIFLSIANKMKWLQVLEPKHNNTGIWYS